MHKLITWKIPSSVINTSSNLWKCFLWSAVSTMNRKSCSGYSWILHFNTSPTCCSNFNFFSPKCIVWRAFLMYWPGKKKEKKRKKCLAMYLTCKGTITVPHFNMSSKYNLSITLLGNDMTKTLYLSYCEILCFYSKPFSDNLRTRDKRWISIIPIYYFF